MKNRSTPDLGTPAVAGPASLTLTIDGKQVRVAPGTSVLRAAALAGSPVPKLCATDTLGAFGSCRMCLVEIEGHRGTPASCTTPCEDGMVVRTQSEQLAGLRRGVMELYLSDHPTDCLTCASNGNCELQDTAGEVGVRAIRYGQQGASHLGDALDISSPYFTYDPARCIVCSRCVRACEEVQGTFALNLLDRGFATRIGFAGPDLMGSECVSCGACVEACPTATLVENTVIHRGQPTHSVTTTCAYCGVGCSLKAELKGEQVVRMVPDRAGHANHGHACIKGRFAWGYATHPDRVTTPLIRDHADDPWRAVGWDEAIAFAAAGLKRVQAQYGTEAVGAIASSRCSNEEAYLVQKLVRAAFGNNNIDNCSRVCHSPSEYGLKASYGEAAGTQDFDSVREADLILVCGANPTDAHPVFASALRRSLREGAGLIVIDPRHTGLLDTLHAGTGLHLQLRPGTNVAVLNALAYTLIEENLVNTGFVGERCDETSWLSWRDFIMMPEHAPEAVAAECGVPAGLLREAARRYGRAGRAAIYYGLGVTEHSQGSTGVMALANLALATGHLGRDGVGVNPLRGQNNVQGACDMGAVPHELTGYRHVGLREVRESFEAEWGVTLPDTPGLRIPQMFDAALAGQFRGLYCQGEDIAQSDPDSQHVTAALRAMDFIVVQDLFHNETARFAHVLLPGSSFLEKDGTFTNAERRVSRIRQVMAPLGGLADWQVTCALSAALGYPMPYTHPSEIMDEIARLTPTFAGISYPLLERLGSVQWPCNALAPEGTTVLHRDTFTRGRGMFNNTRYVPTTEQASARYPLILTTGRILPHYNVGTQTRRSANIAWAGHDQLHIHPLDAASRGIGNGDRVELASRSGHTSLSARVTEHVPPGVVYASFHFPESHTNLLTTGNSDWATNCPEFKVTAVEVSREAGSAAPAD